MKSNKNDSLLMIGIAFAVLGAILLSYAYIQPRVYENDNADACVSLVQTVQTTVEVEYPLNINTATAEELMTINGVGEKRAYAIVEYRDVIGGYSSVEQIKDISGISDSIYYSIAGYLVV